MIVPEHVSKKKAKMVHSRISINSDFYVQVAEENFYNFAGELLDVYFVKYMHPDYSQECISAIKAVKSGEHARIITILKNGDGLDFVTDIEAFFNPDTGYYDLELSVIDMMEAKSNLYHDNMLKYREFLSLKKQFLFDYSPKLNIFSLYMYVSGKCLLFSKGSLEEFRDRVLQAYDNEKDELKLRAFCEYLAKAEGNYDGKLRLIIGEETEFKLCSVLATSCHSWSFGKMIIGTLNIISEDGEDVNPYYATAEATDSLTGLYNKRASHEYTEDMLRISGSSTHYMAIIDIDNFKEINDSYGHMFGDKVISKVAEIMNDTLSGRGIVGRFGGDEFYIFTNKIEDGEKLRTFLTTMRQNVSHAFDDENVNIKVTLSIGVSCCPCDGRSYEELFKKADKCLYIAKSKGKNRYVIYSEDKHGNIDITEKVVAHIVDPIERGEYLASFTADSQIRLFDEGASAIQDVLEKAVKNFDLDAARVLVLGQEKPAYVIGNYSKIPDMNGQLDKPEFLNLFNKNNVLTVGNYSHYESRIGHIAKMHMDSEIMATVCYFCDTKKGNRVFFFYDVFNHSGRWSDTEKNYLIGLSKVIASRMD